MNQTHDCGGAWVKKCAGCGALTNDWLTMYAHYIADGKGGVPLCPDCCQREIDYRKEKGE